MKCLECGKEMKQIQDPHFKGTCTGTVKSFKEYKEKYPNALTRDPTCKSCALTLENMIKKYGEMEGKIRWDSYCKKQSISNTFEYKKENTAGLENNLTILIKAEQPL